jgi:hypothetical protein
MDKPIPYTETKQIMDFIAMQHWIDEKYAINARDYAGKYAKCPRWPDIVTACGVAPERAQELYKTPLTEVTNPLERAAMEAASEKVREHMDNTPYQDFWHFQLELFHTFSNDSYQNFCLGYQMEACKEDWQREIAQLWLDEYSEFMDEDGCIEVWVCW